MDYSKLSHEEIESLRKFAQENGHYWKKVLRRAWFYASLTGTIHHLRNVSYFGPSGLDKFRLDKAIEFDSRRMSILPTGKA